MAPSTPKDDYKRAIELTQEAMDVSDETNYQEGERLLRKAMRLVPDESAFAENYAQFCLQVAENSMIAEDFAQAVVYYKKALEGNPEDPETLMDLGGAYAQKNDPIKAVEAWQEALTLLNPKKGKDKQNIDHILENVRIVQKAMESGQ